MDPIDIVSTEKTEGGYHVVVEVGKQDPEESITFNVIVDDDYYELLTGRAVDVETLVEESFKFLLSKEPKESILREFDLNTIGKYFPNFEFEMKTRLNS